MECKNFDELVKMVQKSQVKTVVLAGGHDVHSLETVLGAHKKGMVDYILTGNKEEILTIGCQLGFTVDVEKIIDTDSDKMAAYRAVECIRQSKGNFLMKGKMETGTLLKEVVNKETGIGTGKTMSHMCILQIPTYHKLVGFSDGGMLLYPTLEQKVDLLKNGLQLFRQFGYENPKVAVVAPVEKVNPKMQETVDAAELKKMADAGMFGDCALEGPISFDLAFSKEAARIKEYKSPVTGEVDLMIVPNISTGNIMTKALMVLGGAVMAGCVLGAQVPIALNSRGASAEEKYYSLLLCAALA